MVDLHAFEVVLLNLNFSSKLLHSVCVCVCVCACSLQAEQVGTADSSDGKAHTSRHIGRKT